MNKVKNAPVKNTGANTGRKANKQTLAKLVTNAQGLPVITLPENTTGEQVKKARKASELQVEKIATNEAHKQDTKTLTYNLNRVKMFGAKYVQLLNKKYELALTGEDIVNYAKNFAPLKNHLTEKQLVKFNSKSLNFSVWLILGLIGKLAQEHKKQAKK